MFAPISESGSKGGIGFTKGAVAILVANVITLLFIIYVYFYAFPWQPNMSASIYLHVSLRGGIHGDVITTRAKVDCELNRLEAEDIIEKIPDTDETPWISPVVKVPKKEKHNKALKKVFKLKNHLEFFDLFFGPLA